MSRDMSGSLIHGWRRWLALRGQALRAFSFPVSALPVLIAAAAARPIAQWRWDVVALSVLGVLLMHGAGNLLNDYFDFKSGVDRKIEDRGTRPGRLMVRGELLPGEVLFSAVACLLLFLPVSLYLLWRCGLMLLAFGIPPLFALYAYTGPPFRLKYRAAGELIIFLIFGPALLLGSAFAQTGSWEWSALRLSVPVGFATTAVLVGNNIRDEEEDRSARIVTLAHFLGVRATCFLYMFLIIGSVAAASFLGAAGLAPRILLAAPGLLILIRKPLLLLYRGTRLPDIDLQTARFASALMLLLFVAMVRIGG